MLPFFLKFVGRRGVGGRHGRSIRAGEVAVILLCMLGLVIPVKMLDSTKMRLSASLDPDQRRRLTLAMLADVLRATEHIPHRIVVTKDPDAEAVAIANGCTICVDPGVGLNGALDSAGLLAMSMEVGRLLVIPSDVPTVTRSDLVEMVNTNTEVVIARSKDGGTNGLLRSPADVIPAMFGPQSASAHAREAARRGVPTVTLDLPSLANDIDDMTGLAELAALDDDTQSSRFARSILS